MSKTRRKPTHATIEGTQRGYRATVWSGNTAISSIHFDQTRPGRREIDECYAAVKRWLTQFGLS